jgi:hypothetical protein
MEQFTIVAGVQFWKGKTGRIEIVITDTVAGYGSCTTRDDGMRNRLWAL